MKNKLICFIVLLSMTSNLAFADCDYSKIVANPDGTRTYSKELHICVGQMKQDLEVANKKVEDLSKAIELKDLAITKSDQRADLWKDTSFKLEDRVETIYKMERTNGWLYFGLGALTVLGSAYVTSRLIHP